MKAQLGLVRILSIGAVLIVMGTLSAAAGTITISGSDFNNSTLVGAYNGTYIPGSPGYMHLAYTASDDDAVVGAKGPLGVLSDLSMSFEYSNLSGGNGNLPYAAFGLSTNGLWNQGGQQFMVIAMSGNQLNGTTPIHVFDSTAGADYSPVAWGTTLASILSYTHNGVAFGDMQVMRAYAYIGNWPGTGNVSVDINSITVSSSVPEPSLLLLLGVGIGAITLTGWRR